MALLEIRHHMRVMAVMILLAFFFVRCMPSMHVMFRIPLSLTGLMRFVHLVFCRMCMFG